MTPLFILAIGLLLIENLNIMFTKVFYIFASAEKVGIRII